MDIRHLAGRGNIDILGQIVPSDKFCWVYRVEQTYVDNGCLSSGTVHTSLVGFSEGTLTNLGSVRERPPDTMGLYINTASRRGSVRLLHTRVNFN